MYIRCAKTGKMLGQSRVLFISYRYLFVSIQRQLQVHRDLTSHLRASDQVRISIMAVEDIVTDPSLLPVLQTSTETLSQCYNLVTLLEKTVETTQSSPETIGEISRHLKHVYALLAKLRGLNRDAIHNVRLTKQATAEARQEIDRLHLHLQNLYYEQRHLNGEIAACESYECVFLLIYLRVSRLKNTHLC